MRYLVHRFIVGDTQIAENQVVYRPPFRALSNVITDHPFLGAYDFSADPCFNLCPSRSGSITIGSGSGNGWSSTAGRYGGGYYNNGGGTWTGGFGILGGEFPSRINKCACSLMVKFPTNDGRVTVSWANCSVDIVPVGSVIFTSDAVMFGNVATLPKVVPADGAWHHVLYNFDGDTGTYAFYVDGSLVSSAVVSAWNATPLTDISTYGGFSVQTNGGDGTQATVTAIDNVVLAIKPFTASAIAKLNAGQLPSLPSVIDLWNAGWFV